jgi:GT2 family glycosyltransferase
LCFRARKHGWKILYCPDSRIIHFGGHATWKVAGKLYIERFKSLLLFFSLYYPGWQVLLYRAVLLLTAVLRILLLPTPLYKVDIGLGTYKGGQRKLDFSRRAAFSTYVQLIGLAFSAVPKP